MKMPSDLEHIARGTFVAVQRSYIMSVEYSLKLSDMAER